MNQRRPCGWTLGLVCVSLMQVAAACAFAAPPTRVTSLNLCTDNLLLELAPSAQELQLTRLAGDPGLSPLASRARHSLRNSGRIEAILAFDPQLILATGNESAVDLLRRLGFRVEIFAPVSDLARTYADLRRLGRLLGLSSKAETIVAALAARLAGLPRLSSPGTAVLLSGHGFAPAAGTLGPALLSVVGLVDKRESLARSAAGSVALEDLVLAPPDWIIVGMPPTGSPSLAHEFLRHPALRAALSTTERLIPLPEMLWTCGGTAFADAALALSQALVRGGSEVRR